MKYFNPNWYQINKAIREGNLSELRIQHKAILNTIDRKIKSGIAQRKEAERNAKIKALKEAPDGTEIYYTGYYSPEIEFGAKGEKQNGKKKIVSRMVVKYNDKLWNCEIKNLQLEPPTEQQLRSYRIN